MAKKLLVIPKEPERAPLEQLESLLGNSLKKQYQKSLLAYKHNPKVPGEAVYISSGSLGPVVCI